MVLFCLFQIISSLKLGLFWGIVHHSFLPFWVGPDLSIICFLELLSWGFFSQQNVFASKFNISLSFFLFTCYFFRKWLILVNCAIELWGLYVFYLVKLWKWFLLLLKWVSCFIIKLFLISLMSWLIEWCFSMFIIQSYCVLWKFPRFDAWFPPLLQLPVFLIHGLSANYFLLHGRCNKRVEARH